MSEPRWVDSQAYLWTNSPTYTPPISKAKEREPIEQSSLNGRVATIAIEKFKNPQIASVPLRRRQIRAEEISTARKNFRLISNIAKEIITLHEKILRLPTPAPRPQASAQPRPRLELEPRVEVRDSDLLIRTGQRKEKQRAGEPADINQVGRSVELMRIKLKSFERPKSFLENQIEIRHRKLEQIRLQPASAEYDQEQQVLEEEIRDLEDFIKQNYKAFKFENEEIKFLKSGKASKPGSKETDQFFTNLIKNLSAAASQNDTFISSDGVESRFQTLMTTFLRETDYGQAVIEKSPTIKKLLENQELEPFLKALENSGILASALQDSQQILENLAERLGNSHEARIKSASESLGFSELIQSGLERAALKYANKSDSEIETEFNTHEYKLALLAETRKKEGVMTIAEKKDWLIRLEAERDLRSNYDVSIFTPQKMNAFLRIYLGTPQDNEAFPGLDEEHKFRAVIHLLAVNPRAIMFETNNNAVYSHFQLFKLQNGLERDKVLLENVRKTPEKYLINKPKRTQEGVEIEAFRDNLKALMEFCFVESRDNDKKRQILEKFNTALPKEGIKNYAAVSEILRDLESLVNPK